MVDILMSGYVEEVETPLKKEVADKLDVYAMHLMRKVDGGVCHSIGNKTLFLAYNPEVGISERMLQVLEPEGKVIVEIKGRSLDSNYSSKTLAMVGQIVGQTILELGFKKPEDEYSSPKRY